MENQEYDVVVVGSGIAGSVLAKVLTQAGKQVLLMEAGLQAGITDAQSIDVLQIQAQTPYTEGYLVQLGPLPFASDCLRAPGDTTLHWLGNVPRMLPNDFQMKTLYGQGVDWPISYQDLMPYYEMAENEIGVAGDVAAQQGPNMGPANYGPGYVFPMFKIPQSYQDQVWMKNSNGLAVTLDGIQYTITCVSMPQGRNSDPNPAYHYGTTVWDPLSKKLKLHHNPKTYAVVASNWSPYTGERCEGNANCVPICPVQAKYNALKTLNKAKRDHLTILTQSVASTVAIDPDSGLVSGLVYKVYKKPDSKDYTTHLAKGKIYVLACSAIENAKILLASNAANSSDQVGRNLMDHLVFLTWGLLPEKVYPYRGPGCTTYIPTFRDGAFRKDFAAWISPIDNWGWSWPTFAPGSDVTNAVIGNNLFGRALRQHLNDTVPRQGLLHFECEQTPEPDNRVMIFPQYKDQLDNFRPVIQYNANDYMRKSFKAAKEVSDQIFAANNITDYSAYSPSEPDYVTWQGCGYTFRGAGHIVGTHRMGNSAAESVVDANQRCWDHHNLYLAGCGNMPTLGTSNPTLTMTALTFKAAEAILQQLDN